MNRPTRNSYHIKITNYGIIQGLTMKRVEFPILLLSIRTNNSADTLVQGFELKRQHGARSLFPPFTTFGAR